MNQKRNLFSLKSIFVGFSFFLFSSTLLGISVPTKVPSLSSSEHDASHKTTEVKMGERIFYGLQNSRDKLVNCASCHNTAYVDTLNWNPSALDLAKAFHKKELGDLKAALINPTSSKKIMADHEGINLNDEQIVQLMSYFKYLAATGTNPQKDIINRLLAFLAVLGLIGLALLDLAVTKKIRFKFIHIGVIFLSLGYIGKTLVYEGEQIGRSTNYEPDQPIKFSHKIHATDNKIDCQYCHHIAEDSKHAGIPSTSVCMNCHIIVREGTNSGKFEINKLVEAHENGEYIKWIKIHNLPEHVYFNHAQHVGAGKLECQECHGDVENMDRVKQVQDLSMGWCVNCHRDTEVKFDNAFYKQYEGLIKKLHEGKIDKVTVENIGGLDCNKCHY